MNAPIITADEVIFEAEIVTKTAQMRLNSDLEMLHGQGYTKYERVLSNFKSDIEKALVKLVDEING